MLHTVHEADVPFKDQVLLPKTKEECFQKALLLLYYRKVKLTVE